jgi:MtN3 and saliva related transmembrane protein
VYHPFAHPITFIQRLRYNGENMNYNLILGFVAATLTTIAFAPQAIKVYKTKRTEDISILMYISFVSGVVLWMLYGFLVGDLAVLICNVVTFMLASPVLFFVVRNRRS